MTEPLELQIARSKIERYAHDADDSVVRASIEAQDCLDCEAFLASGIRALDWLERSEEALSEAANEGFLATTVEMEAAIETLYAAWLHPCSLAEAWISRCQNGGFEVGNLSQFRECCERVRDWLARSAHFRQAKAARDSRFAAEPW